MNGFYIQIQNGLLRDGHRQRMGSAVWEYMWCLDKLTKIDDDGNGYVLGGKPVRLVDLKKELQTSEDQISENLSSLERNGYITKTRTPYGIIIKINKAKKRFGEKTDSNSGKMPNLKGENAESNKTRQLDNTVRQRETSLSYLKDIPLEDLERFNSTYQATRKQILEKAEALALWCESKGKAPKNYRATLQGALLRDYGKRTNGGYTRI